MKAETLSTYTLLNAICVLGHKLWVPTTFHKMLFDGYDDCILRIVDTVSSLFGT
jgi:hypothetical protein